MAHAKRFRASGCRSPVSRREGYAHSYPYCRAPITAGIINHPGEHHSELIKWPRTRAMMSEQPWWPTHLHRWERMLGIGEQR